ncbi:MAG: peptidylprolyl isomerase [Gammaproteobacteria bacterium]|nr:peptidylprolyl isomerase [Gammaproteobacteria bacterium]
MRPMILTLLLVLSTNSYPQANPIVDIETSKGLVSAELYADKAPISVENFLRYVDNGFFNDLIFHRVIPNFMIQGGGFSDDMVQKTGYEPIKNEARSDVPNVRGTLAMARTNIVDSATSQFFINLIDNDYLNHTDDSPRGFGYAVFGAVISGMEVIDEIATVETGIGRGGHQNVPKEPVMILRIKRQQ